MVRSSVLPPRHETLLRHGESTVPRGATERDAATLGDDTEQGGPTWPTLCVSRSRCGHAASTTFDFHSAIVCSTDARTRDDDVAWRVQREGRLRNRCGVNCLQGRAGCKREASVKVSWSGSRPQAMFYP
ncbi:hypothetical protein ERJ75_001111300 [Trypanosoma vivax]|nr:hypothetical protein ERJ75_001111300 [Trypanosoma vivax]